MTVRTCLLAFGFMSAAVFAQSSDPNEPVQVLDKVKGGAVRERAPGLLLTQARERHQSFIDLRVNGPRFGEPVGSASAAAGGSTTGAGSTSDPDAGSSLDDVLGNLLSGDLDLNDLAGAVTNNGLAPALLGTGVGGDVDVTGLLDDLAGRSKSSTAQTTTPDEPAEPTFLNRWADELLQTTFAGLILAVSTQEFVDVIKDALRPLFGLDTSSEDAADAGSAPTDGDGDGDARDDSIVLLQTAAPLI